MSGKIKIARIYKYDYHLVDAWESEIEIEPYLYNVTGYDHHGNITLEVSQSADFSTTSKSERKYDAEGRLTEEIIWDENDEIMERTTYERDENGRILRHLEHYLDGSFDITHYTYDDEGNLIEKVTITDEDETEGREKFHFENGKLVKSEEFDEENKLITSSEYVFDDHGNLIEQKNKTLEGGNTSLRYEYDENNHRTMQMQYNEIGRLIEKISYTYDENGRVTHVLEEDERKKNTTEFTLDDQGRAVWQIEKDVFGEIVLKVERQYDADGNITRLTAFIKSPGNYPDQNYVLSYEYEHFEEL